MSNNPLVSIGLPTYNRARTLGRAIDSVLHQTYQHIELVISDNASGDETEAVCRAAAERDSRIKYLRQPANVGPTANFREVFDHSSGEFFMWLADDDWLDYPYVAGCVQFLRDHDDHSLICGKARYFRDGKFDSEGKVASIQQESANARILNYYSTVVDNGTFYGMMRRSHLTDISLQNTMGGDWLFTAAIAFRGKIGALEDVHLNRSLDGSSFSFKKIATSLALSRFSGVNPRISIASAAFKDILTSPVYSRCGKLGRAVLGCKVFAVIERRKGFYDRPLRGFFVNTLKRVLPESVVVRIYQFRSDRRIRVNN
jgi:glycosyltransferase involved in cell wall biosynthesis